MDRSESFKAKLNRLETRIEYLEKLADLRKRLHDDTRVAIVCALHAVKAIEKQLGVSLMAKGRFYGVKF